MIFLDVMIPRLDLICDFELDEEKEAGALTDQIVRLVAEKEGMACDPDEKMYLYAFEKEGILDEKKSLKQQGICGGERLILI